MKEFNEAYGVDVNKLLYLVEHGSLPQDPPGKGAQTGLHTFQEPSPSPSPVGRAGVGTNSESIPRIAKLLHVSDYGVPDTETRFSWEECPTGGYAGWRFYGQGVAYPDCGTFWRIGCLEHHPGYAKSKKRSCGRAECPVCSATSWLPRAVAKGTKRIMAGLPRSYSAAVHFTISSPPKTWKMYGNNRTYLKMRRKTISMAKMAGIHGGVLIFHPYRGNKKAGWRYAPHFHIIGVGYLLKYDRLKPKLKGWLVKNHGIRRGGKSIGGTLKYQLSHAGVRPDNHVVSWFGSMSWNKLQKIPDPPAEPETCPVCGGPLARIIFYGTGPNPFQGDIEELPMLDIRDWAYSR